MPKDSVYISEREHEGALVSIIMGSKSDFPTMGEAAEILKQFGIQHEITVVSAHRTPDRMYSFAKGAAGRGVKVIIAGAGGAAHLPGMVAAMTPLPVIGVPVQSKTMSGVDSLYSIVQMPPGIPVATVAIGGAKNAGLLAARILGVYMPDVSDKLERYRADMEKSSAQSALEIENGQPSA